MSGLIDMWTLEMAKLRNKVEANSSAQASQQAASVSGDEKSGGLTWLPTGWVEAVRAKKLPALQFSEASLSMIMDNFSA